MRFEFLVLKILTALLRKSMKGTQAMDEGEYLVLINSVYDYIKNEISDGEKH